MRTPLWCAGLGVLLSLGAGHAFTQEKGGPIDVKVVKYDGLKEAVLQNRGKVVVVDFWSTSCPPCIRNFPHMLETQKKYGKLGLVSLSVSLDKVDNDLGETPEKMKEKVVNRLRKLGSNIPNLLLDESDQVVQEKLRIDSIPSVYVFNRQGKWTKFGGTAGEGVDPAAVEKLVVELLQEK